MINFLYIVYGNIDRINFNAYSTFKKKIISLLDGLWNYSQKLLGL